MTDNELLLAISGLLEPIKVDIREMKSDIRDITYEVRELRNDVEILKTDVRILKDRMDTLTERVDTLTDRVDTLTDRVDELTCRVDNIETGMSDMQTRLIRIELTQENIIIPRLQTIESCYTSTYDRYKSGVDEHDAMQQDLSILKRVVTEHSRKLQFIP